AMENFAISGVELHEFATLIEALASVKQAAAEANRDLGLLKPEIASAIIAACAEIRGGEHHEHFRVDMIQGGAGTSTNMNANEVIANLAGDGAHPNDHVNMGQSSNDVFPSAVHLAALGEVTHELLPAMDELSSALERKSEEFANVVKAGRTHLMDAVPVTLGQEFGGYAAQVKLGIDRVRSTLGRVGQIPLGGTATGTGLNTHSEFAERVRAKLVADTGLEISEPLDPFEAQGNRDALVELSGALKVVAVSLTKIANDLALMGSGPRAGLAELRLPALQKGSSIMPGKVNPVICEVVIQVGAQVIGNDAAVTIAGSQGQFELNVRVPLIARNLLDSIKLLAAACRLLDTRCVEGIEADVEVAERHAEATLATATALNPHIGYDRGAEIVKRAQESGRPVREVAREMGVDEEILDQALDHHQMARPHG
ncbi:MAG: class II fumarate hydratase, partial [Solirubrobacterales bacterium]